MTTTMVMHLNNIKYFMSDGHFLHKGMSNLILQHSVQLGDRLPMWLVLPINHSEHDLYVQQTPANMGNRHIWH